MIQTWFAQANYYTGGSGQGQQGATGYSPYTSDSLVVPAHETRDLDLFPSGIAKITTYRLHLENDAEKASSTVDLLETSKGVRHNVYAELGKSSIYEVGSGATGIVTYINIHNTTDSELAVTFLKTSA